MHILIVVCSNIVLCAGKVAALSDFEAALARGFDGVYFVDRKYDLYSCLSHCSEVYKIMLHGTALITALDCNFIDVMPELRHIYVAELVGCAFLWEKIDRVKPAPHCIWLNVLWTTSIVSRIANMSYETVHLSHHSEAEWVDYWIDHCRYSPQSHPEKSPKIWNIIHC